MKEPACTGMLLGYFHMYATSGEKDLPDVACRDVESNRKLTSLKATLGAPRHIKETSSTVSLFIRRTTFSDRKLDIIDPNKLLILNIFRKWPFIY